LDSSSNLFFSISSDTLGVREIVEMKTDFTFFNSMLIVQDKDRNRLLCLPSINEFELFGFVGETMGPSVVFIITKHSPNWIMLTVLWLIFIRANEVAGGFWLACQEWLKETFVTLEIESNDVSGRAWNTVIAKASAANAPFIPSASP